MALISLCFLSSTLSDSMNKCKFVIFVRVTITVNVNDYKWRNITGCSLMLFLSCVDFKSILMLMLANTPIF